MSSFFVLPRQFVIDGAGVPRAGAKLFFYAAGTLTAQDTYSDDALTTPNTNPVVADSSGHFGAIYLENTAYRVILKDSDDVQIWDQDDYNAPLLGLFGSTFLTKNGNYTVSTDDKGAFIDFTAQATASLPAVADAGEGFTIAIFNSGTSTVVIDPDSTEQINGENSITLISNHWALITTDGSAWIAFPSARRESGSFTASLTGMNATVEGTVNYEITGHICTLRRTSALEGTSDETFMQLDGLPIACIPASQQMIPTIVQDNGSLIPGMAEIDSGGATTITFWAGSSLSATGFTNSGGKGLGLSPTVGWSMVYPLD